jgi:acyl-coenzyme A thioesterase PaaI-like protein
MSDTTGRVLATGRVIHPGRRLMTVEATMTAEAGDQLIAHGTSACIVLR